jgi:hypothetical protein
MQSSKIYINTPANSVAGGVEALFQLADAINNLGGNAILLWDIQLSDPIPDKYKHYNVKQSMNVEDNSDNWIIYPEVWTEKIYDYKYIKKAIWWLSVDNNQDKFKDFNNSEITHFYQSQYALNFLINNKVEKYLPLTDYISPNYTEAKYIKKNKKNIICYNPVKGAEITKKIILACKDFEFVPIVGMNEFQIINLLKSSKVYIDFGHHPGKDRIPREAAILGNCILTNTQGAAAFYNDLPIIKKYKTSEVEEVKKNIIECFNNYDEIINDFLLYRLSIKNQKLQFTNFCKQIFEIKDQNFFYRMINN